MPRSNIWLPKDMHEAWCEYRDEGHDINLSREVQVALVQKFRLIEHARVLLNERPVLTTQQIDRMEERIGAE